MNAIKLKSGHIINLDKCILISPPQHGTYKITMGSFECDLHIDDREVYSGCVLFHPYKDFVKKIIGP